MVGDDTVTEPPPVDYAYHWAFDDTALVEADGGPSFTVITDSTQTPVYHATPLAPGSTWSVELPANRCAIESTVPMVAGVDGVVTLDAWLSGLTTATFDDVPVALFEDMSTDPVDRGQYRVVITGEPAQLHFWSLAPHMTVLVLDDWPDPMHVQWSVQAGALSQILINGDVAASVEDAFVWDYTPGQAHVTFGSGLANTIRVDEVRLYNTGPP